MIIQPLSVNFSDRSSPQNKIQHNQRSFITRKLHGTAPDEPGDSPEFTTTLYPRKLPRSRGCVPARRLTLLSCHKRVSRKGHPNSLPAIAFGDGRFPPFNRCFEELQKLATLKHLPLCFSNQLFHCGCVTR